MRSKFDPGFGHAPFIYAINVHKVKLVNVHIVRYKRSMADIPVTERLKRVRVRAGVSMAEAAKALGYKTASGYQHYEDPSKFAKKYLPREIIEALAPLFAGRGDPPVREDEVWALGGPPRSDAFQPEITRYLEPRGALVPVYAAARGGEGHLIIDFNPVEQVSPPDEIARVRGAYGILIVGDSMVPAYRPGDIAWVNPHKPLERDTDVVLYHVAPHGEAEAIIKALVGITERYWKLRQYNPPMDFNESRADWTVCHRIVGKKNVR